MNTLIRQLLSFLFGSGKAASKASRGAAGLLQRLFGGASRGTKPPAGVRGRPLRGRGLEDEFEQEDKPQRTSTAKKQEAGFQMIRVASSNVHSIGYQDATGTLAVRFLAPEVVSAGQGVRLGGKTSGPGPLYHYFDVPPKLWASFQSAASKGKWVWDNLRIRGTIAGHRYDYRLVAGTMASSGLRLTYIPRRASGKGFMSRSRFQEGKREKSLFKSRRFSTAQKGKQFNRGR